jgi:hypothetical protein
MIEQEVEQFDVRAITKRELSWQVHFAKNMLVASAIASFAIIGAGAYVLSLL